MFPTRGPGIGLLLLRISVALTFVWHVANRTEVTSFSPLLLGASLVSLCLVVGVLTPYLSAIAGVYALVNLFTVSTRVEQLVLSCLILNSAALALLGPGAYSIDARLFGRRVVVVPPKKDADRI